MVTALSCAPMKPDRILLISDVDVPPNPDGFVSVPVNHDAPPFEGDRRRISFQLVKMPISGQYRLIHVGPVTDEEIATLTEETGIPFARIPELWINEHGFHVTDDSRVVSFESLMPKSRPEDRLRLVMFESGHYTMLAQWQIDKIKAGLSKLSDYCDMPEGVTVGRAEVVGGLIETEGVIDVDTDLI